MTSKLCKAPAPTLVDPLTDAQKQLRRQVDGYVLTHPIAVEERIEPDGTLNVHVLAADRFAERIAVDELAQLFDLPGRLNHEQRYAALRWPSQFDDVNGFGITDWSANHDGEVVVWAGRSRDPKPPRVCPTCQVFPCKCVKPSPGTKAVRS